MKKKTVALLMAVVMLFGVTVGGTLAWLKAETTEVKNTFTPSDIGLTLTETTTDYQMVPGNKIAKDPVVKVDADSEDCWLFVKIEKSSNYGTYLEEYSVRSPWVKLQDGVYYIEGAKANDEYYVLAGEGTAELANGFVTVKTSVTKADMEAITDAASQPTLTFTAYAVQSANVTDAATAWQIAQGLKTN